MPESTIELVSINTFQDIESYFNRLTKGENVGIGEISETITISIKLDGGRFINYEAPYVDAVIANMVLAHQESYKRIVKQLDKNYGINDFDSELLLQFKLEQGCCEAELKAVKDILEVIKDMPVESQIATIAALLIGFLGVGAYRLIKQNMQNNKEIVVATMSHNERSEIEQDRHAEVIHAIDKMSNDYIIEKAVNYSKEKTLKLLNIDENLSYQADNGTRTAQVTKNQIDNYEVNVPEQVNQEIESVDIITIKVATMSYGTDEKMVKTIGSSQLFNRDMLTIQDRITLAGKADNNESINVEVKFIKDQNEKILRAYLLKIVE